VLTPTDPHAALAPVPRHGASRAQRRAARYAGLGRYQRGPRRRRDDIDDIAVERAMYGDPIVLTLPERKLAVQLLSSRGHSALEIACRLRIAPRTVARYRAAERAQPLSEGAA
jgi:DNA-binding NarL/FixJ family response regulator